MGKTLLTLSAICLIAAAFFGIFTENETYYSGPKYNHQTVVRQMKGSHRVLYTIASFERNGQ